MYFIWQDLRAQEGLLDHQGQQEKKEKLDCLVFLDIPAHLETKAKREPKEDLEIMEKREKGY